MTVVDPDDYMMVADVLEQMYKSEITWPDDLNVRSSRIELRYYTDDGD